MKNTNHELTTIVIRKSTRKTLKHLARKDQNYDDLLIQLLENKSVSGSQLPPTAEQTISPEPKGDNC
jgi:hypothetical protein